MLENGYHDVPRGKLAAVVTFLEMTAKPQHPKVDFGSGLRLEQLVDPSLDAYRALFMRVGAPWLWSDRVELSNDALRAILSDPDYRVFSLSTPAQGEGLLELDFRKAGECELAYFGLSSELIGTGNGRALMNAAIDIAWRHPISRFWVHTCTLDSPSATEFYLRSGFQAYKRSIEVMDDPRLTLGFDQGLAPFAPIIQPTNADGTTPKPDDRHRA